VAGYVGQVRMRAWIVASDRADEGAQVDALATEPRSAYGGLLGQLCGIHRIGIGGQLGEISELADLE
jgi:hypothetical protein